MYIYEQAGVQGVPSRMVYVTRRLPLVMAMIVPHTPPRSVYDPKYTNTARYSLLQSRVRPHHQELSKRWAAGPGRQRLGLKPVSTHIVQEKPIGAGDGIGRCRATAVPAL